MLVPIRSFDDAKSRLAGVLDADQRRTLVQTMAETVVKAAVDLPVVVVTDDATVAAWAEGLGVRVVAPGVAGLSPSVAAGVDRVLLVILGQGNQRLGKKSLTRTTI